MDPNDLKEMIDGCRIIYQCIGGTKTVLPEEQSTIDFAYASVVSIANIKIGEKFTKENIWVKRPGNGEILAEEFNQILTRTANVDIPKNTQIQRKWIR
jgi:N-acetylneuraminate synthase